MFVYLADTTQSLHTQLHDYTLLPAGYSRCRLYSLGLTVVETSSYNKSYYSSMRGNYAQNFHRPTRATNTFTFDIKQYEYIRYQ